MGHRDGVGGHQGTEVRATGGVAAAGGSHSEPLTARGRWRWTLAFFAVSAAVTATTPIGTTVDAGALWASAGLLVLAAATAVLPWQGFPRPAQLLPPLLYVASIGVLLVAPPMASIGLQPIALLPVLAVALFYRPWESVVVVAAASAMLAVTSVVEHQADAVAIRRVLIIGVIGAGMSAAVQLARRRLAAEIDNEAEQLRQASVLAEAARTFHGLRDPGEVARAGARYAALITPGVAGTRRGVYLAVAPDRASGAGAHPATGAGSRPPGATAEATDLPEVAVAAEYDESGARLPLGWSVGDHPHLQQVLRTAAPATGSLSPGDVGPSVASVAAAAGLTHVAGAPVFVEGRLSGVLGAAGRGAAIGRTVMMRLEALADMVGLAMTNARAIDDLVRQALADPLTGAANRRGLELYLSKLGRRPFAVVSVDLDDLKGLNDRSGHEAGDRAIAGAARSMAAVLRPEDLLARTGGDEFVAVLADVGPGEARAVADRMLRALQTGVATGSGIAASFGVAEGWAGGRPDAVLARADGAMYRAKRYGGAQVVEGATE